MTVKQTIQTIQRLAGTEPDGIWGRLSQAALDKLAAADPDAEWPPKESAPKNVAVGESSGTAVNVPPLALEIIKEFESCLEPAGESHSGEALYKSYPDPGYGWNLPTIGWGTVKYENGVNVKKGDVITQARADELLQWEVTQKTKGVENLVKVSLTEGQKSALISFAYNVGLGALEGSTLLKLLNAGQYESAANQLPYWNKSNGVVLAGLTRRRQSERNMFLGVTPWLVT